MAAGWPPPCARHWPGNQKILVHVATIRIDTCDVGFGAHQDVSAGGGGSEHPVAVHLQLPGVRSVSAWNGSPSSARALEIRSAAASSPLASRCCRTLSQFHPGRETGQGRAGWLVGAQFPGVAGPASVVADTACQRRTDMGKIVISTSVSLDGVIQDPDGGEGFRRGGWAGQFGGEAAVKGEAAKVLLDEALGTQALLLGRRTDEFFAARWASRSGEWADRLNSMPKYVVSSTLQEPKWNNSTVLRGDVVSEVSKLKQQQLVGDIVVYASYQLVHALL